MFVISHELHRSQTTKVCPGPLLWQSTSESYFQEGFYSGCGWWLSLGRFPRRFRCKSFGFSRRGTGFPVAPDNLTNKESELRETTIATGSCRITITNKQAHRWGKHLTTRERQTPGSEAEWKEVAKNFEAKWNYPCCVGSIDDVLSPGIWLEAASLSDSLSGMLPEKVEIIALTACCLHNYLVDHSMSSYAPQALLDSEDDNHNLHPGECRTERELTALQASYQRNGSHKAKE
ncbi:hypothetical protein P5673_011909 [Acropora cervicornis]|uniref:DDE Tnp4 domain-containing protein n=1 Tax=Acropora cervicornis TaxID=6130 RepID=A0AAD9V830_ACRCE|nr:hypothetical protein P5673_011909 [Acropora cervicornis]